MYLKTLRRLPLLTGMAIMLLAPILYSGTTSAQSKSTSSAPLFANPDLPTAAELRKQRAVLKRTPDNAELAAKIAKGYIKLSRVQGRHRYYDDALAVLAPWWTQAEPPPDILFLRASLRQSEHDFSGALRDLDALLRIQQDNNKAWLMRAIVLQVTGDFAAARKSCQPVIIQPALKLLGVTCDSSVAGFNGLAQTSYDRLFATLESEVNAKPADRQWALTVLADIAQRTGRAEVAEGHFQAALALGRDNWLLGAYADFLLDQDRPQAVIDLLKDETWVDNLLLILTLAEQRLPAAGLARHVKLLKKRFGSGHDHADSPHHREEARLALHLLNDPHTALKLAQDNWQSQHEPEDARILLEAALAAEDDRAAQPVLQFIKTTGLEDVRLTRLTVQLEKHTE